MRGDVSKRKSLSKVERSAIVSAEPHRSMMCCTASVYPSVKHCGCKIGVKSTKPFMRGRNACKTSTIDRDLFSGEQWKDSANLVQVVSSFVRSWSGEVISTPTFSTSPLSCEVSSCRVSRSCSPRECEKRLMMQLQRLTSSA